MKLTLRQVGCLSEAIIEPANLTVLCGGNNTGKTYAMYILWSVLHRRFRHVLPFIQKLVIDLKNHGVVTLSLADLYGQYSSAIEQGMSEALTARLPKLFSASTSLFFGSHVDVALNNKASFEQILKQGVEARLSDDDEAQLLDVRSESGADNLIITLIARELPQVLAAELISRVLFDLLLDYQAKKTFLLPAERGGLNIFYPDLDAQNSAFIRHIKQDDSNPVELIKNLMVAQYPEPIDAYLQFLKKLPRLLKDGTTFHETALQLQKDITQVRYKVNKDGLITAKPYRSAAEIALHLTSSTVKNLFGLWAYLEATAKEGDCLMIDEPELNLHPDNQRLIARFLVRLVNKGIKVVISTHSDYIIREINNMIMLGTVFQNRGDLEMSWEYDKDGSERLLVEQVAAYNFEKKKVSKIQISPEYGIEVTSMDNAINRMNQSNSDIYFALQDALHPVTTPEFVAE